MKNLKPLLWGAVFGAVLTVTVGFSAGWVVTSGTHKEGVTKARVEVLADLCAKSAYAHHVATGDGSSLKGNAARTLRDALAKEFAGGNREVERACALALERLEAV